MKRKLFLIAAVLLVLAMVPLVASADMQDITTVQLIADGGTYYEDTGMWGVDVGEIQIWSDDTNLYVTYVIDAELDPDNIVPTLIYETHLEVQTSLDDFPLNKKGSPQIGKFTYNDMWDPGVNLVEYVVPLSDIGASPGDPLFIGAHAVVQEIGGLGGLEISLPDTVSLKVRYPGVLGEDTYFDAIITNGGVLDGTYDSWCIDVGHTINPGVVYDGIVPYSSYEMIPADATIDKPENLPFVNYVINNYKAGDPSPGGLGNYTMCDIQRAIWTLVDDSVTSCGTFSQNRVNEIVADAYANGVGFEPGCEQQVAVVLVTPGFVQETIQVITIGVEVPCETRSETAWAGPWDDGIRFVDNNWATYITYTLPLPDPVKVAGVRYRSFFNTGADEIYLGMGDLGVGGNRVAAQYNWVKPGSYDVVYTYNPAVTDGEFVQTITNAAGVSQTLVYDYVGDVPEMDSFEIIVADRDAGSQVNFTNVMLNDVSIDGGEFIGNDTFAAYKFYNGTLNDGFEFTGTIYLEGPFSSSQEKSRVEILVGQYIAFP